LFVANITLFVVAFFRTSVVFNRSYCELWAKHWIKVVGSGPARHLEAKSWGAAASRIYPFITTNHEGINLKEKDPDAFRKIVEWIDLNAPYYPDYATSYYDNPYGRCPLTTAEVRQLEKLTGQQIFVSSGVRYYDIATYIDEKEQLNPRDAAFLKAFTSINFDEPEKSPLLRSVTSVINKVKTKIPLIYYKTKNFTEILNFLERLVREEVLVLIICPNSPLCPQKIER
jgi:hypothetical protein